MSDLHRIALHEAGHAVACLALGRKVKEIQIGADGGIVRYGPRIRWRNKSEWGALTDVSVSLGGAVSEALHLMIFNAAQCRADMANVAGRLFLITNEKEQAQSLLEFCWHRTVGKIVEHGRECSAIANELLKHGRLESRSIHAIWESYRPASYRLTALEIEEIGRAVAAGIPWCEPDRPTEACPFFMGMTITAGFDIHCPNQGVSFWARERLASARGSVAGHADRGVSGQGATFH